MQNELLVGLTEDELEALADGILSSASQSRLDELLRLNAAGSLPKDQEHELDRLLARVDQLTILKSRARYTLKQNAAATQA